MKKRVIDVSVGITRGFDNEEKVLPKDVRDTITQSLNSLVEEIETHGWSHKIYRTKNLVFPESIPRRLSTLYLCKTGKKYGVVLSVEDDPIFKQKVVTLYRVAKREDLPDAFSNIADLLSKTM